MTARMVEVVSRLGRAARVWSRATAHAAPPAEEEAERQACPGLKRALERALRAEAKPHVLDLGPLCGPTAMWLADRGARVCVEDLDLPAEPAPAADGEAVAPPPLRIAQPDGKYHLVLAWEHFDFLPPARLPELTAEIVRLLAPGGWLVLYSRDKAGPGAPAAQGTDRRSAFRLVADDAIVRQAVAGDPSPRFIHSTGVLERALAPLKVQGIHLQRDRTREFVALKPER
jgi:hypothetical protein